MRRTLAEKLGSTKLWCAAAGILLGLALALGADENSIRTLAGAVTGLVSAVTYILAESAVDKAAAEGRTE